MLEMATRSFHDDEVLSAIDFAATRLGYPSVRAEQRVVLKAFLKGRDVFVSLPTGFGKSLCYAVLPGAFNMLRGVPESIAVVVSPLIALMRDQVLGLERRGVKAVYYGEADKRPKLTSAREATSLFL